VKHGVTVRTDRNEVFDRINTVVLSDARDWDAMMNMYEPFSKRSISLAEVDAADLTNTLVVPNTGIAGFRGTLVVIHEYLLGQAFGVGNALRNLIRIETGESHRRGRRIRNRLGSRRWRLGHEILGKTINNFPIATAFLLVKLQYSVDSQFLRLDRAVSFRKKAEGLSVFGIILPHKDASDITVLTPHIGNSPYATKEIPCAIISVNGSV
jgi:hypothetical protein